MWYTRQDGFTDPTQIQDYEYDGSGKAGKYTFELMSGIRMAMSQKYLRLMSVAFLDEKDL